MIKSIGAIIILTASVLLGYMPLVRLRKREEVLREWIDILHYMKRELRCNLSDIPTLLQAIEQGGGKTVKSILIQIQKEIEQQGAAVFAASWSNCIYSSCHLLKQEEMDMLSELGTILGSYLMEDELCAIDRTCAILTDGMYDCEIRRKEKSKMYMSVSCAAGIILIVVLL